MSQYDNPKFDDARKYLEAHVKGPITPELVYVQSIIENLADTKTGRFCANFPQNVLGSIVLSEMVAAFRQQYPDPEKYRFDPRLEHALDVLEDVPLNFFDKPTRQQVPLLDQKGQRMTARKVLFKQCVGFASGVITEGPLAGMLVTTPLNDAEKFVSVKEMMSQGLCAERLFNDEAFEDQRPYPPRIETQGLFSAPESHEYMLELPDAFLAYYRDRIASLGPLKTLREALLKFAAQDGITLDQAVFHYFSGNSLRKK